MNGWYQQPRRSMQHGRTLNSKMLFSMQHYNHLSALGKAHTEHHRAPAENKVTQPRLATRVGQIHTIEAGNGYEIPWIDASRMSTDTSIDFLLHSPVLVGDLITDDGALRCLQASPSIYTIDLLGPWWLVVHPTVVL
ncbi:uncharacterized protein SPSK_06729 [Sporothrix schenckii 1099-18]|uniref:Uncharacterized protein n=1 Tax=Sporothrix schenckii 1099-18 TaxID=1397361 RepID=A0A0F2MJ29_SPOSC|nr:uncharacterized protein SPSK_06729 [Sporothrix schenckii 1099-18]KJR89059.1 hypothetical protein SPSK_06729 [Sporothrix schenckii 1099-18]